MGCCGKDNKKTKNKSDLTKTIKTNKTEKKKSLINDKEKKLVSPIKTIDEKNQNQFLKNENNLQQESIKTPINETTAQVAFSPFEHRIKSPSDYEIDDFINGISSTDNISPIKTLDDLQILIQQNEKPVSIILFYGRYCPYSKRTMPDLRQWIRANKDRFFLYEADIEQASKLAEYYHIQTIPTIMAFKENNLLVPIWQRTANNVLSSDSQLLIQNDNNQYENIIQDKSDNIFLILNPSIKELNEKNQEQYLIILDNNNQSIPNKSKLILAMTNEKSQEELLKTIDQSNSDHDSNSIILSEVTPYIWNKSNQSIENHSQKSLLKKQFINEYNGRMISQSTISNDNQSIKKRKWNEYLDDNNKINQHIHLPNCHEIYYEKQYDYSNEFNPSSSIDRFSTLTYQHVKDTNNHLINQQEEISILYLGPNRCRGFEDNISNKNLNPSKYSLLTLKSNSLYE